MLAGSLLISISSRLEASRDGGLCRIVNVGNRKRSQAASALSQLTFGVKTAARTMDIHVRRINRQATDVDVHRTKLPTMEP